MFCVVPRGGAGAGAYGGDGEQGEKKKKRAKHARRLLASGRAARQGKSGSWPAWPGCLPDGRPVPMLGSATDGRSLIRLTFVRSPAPAAANCRIRWGSNLSRTLAVAASAVRAVPMRHAGGWPATIRPTRAWAMNDA